MKRWLIGCLAVIGCLFLSLSYSGNYRQAQLSLAKNDYVNAIKYFRPYAEIGDPISQINMGASYSALHQYKKAFYWFSQAAKAGKAIAIREVGNAYFNGQGVPVDNQKAYHYFLRAAKKGDYIAMVQLAYMLLNGHYQHIPFNVPDAITWANRAVARGEFIAYSTLGVIYRDNLNEPKKAYSYFKLGVEKGSPYAAYELGKSYLYGTGTQVNKAEAYYWLSFAVHHHVTKAKRYLTQLNKTLSAEDLANGRQLLDKRGY